MQTYNLTAHEFTHRISAEKTIKAWGFNNTIPGPTLRAKKGEMLVINVKNELPEATIIHWHGIQLPANMDGTEHVQNPIQPGETFQYKFTAPDAGTFWYHSHHNETVQMERGMYGSIVIEDVEEKLKFDNDRIFMIDDMKLDRHNEFTRGSILERWIERHDGREGNTLLINGQENPVIQMKAGQTERWRFINASSARYFKLHLEGRPFRIIATDGGLIEKPFETTEALITPGERLEIAAGPLAEGERFLLESLPYKRMTMAVKPRRQTFATVEVGSAGRSIATLPENLRVIESLAPVDAVPSRKVNFSVGASLSHGIDFLVNGHTHAHDHPVKQGELQVWEVHNKSLMDHPFHLHGFFFQVLEVNGKQPAYKAWKDTINLAPLSKVKIVWMPDRKGEWMYHCHILEHHAAGMMGHFQVTDHHTAGLH